MKTPPTPTPSPNPSGIIGQREYDQYVANWVAAASDPTGTELAQSFRLGKNHPQLLSQVSFPALQIARLVSTVGAVSIKARFLIIHDDHKQPHFTVALFATDSLDARLSSYYLAHEYWKQPAQPYAAAAADAAEASAAASARPQPVPAVAPARTEVPSVLASFWLNRWGALTQVAPALFATTYGPLRGYTYGVDEFVFPLRQLGNSNWEALKHENLLLEFDLHEYYRTEPQGEVLVHTFGMLLRLASIKLSAGTGGGGGVNMGGPCPPTC